DGRQYRGRRRKRERGLRAPAGEIRNRVRQRIVEEKKRLCRIFVERLLVKRALQKVRREARAGRARGGELRDRFEARHAVEHHAPQHRALSPRGERVLVWTLRITRGRERGETQGRLLAETQRGRLEKHRIVGRVVVVEFGHTRSRAISTFFPPISTA